MLEVHFSGGQRLSTKTQFPAAAAGGGTNLELNDPSFSP